MTNHNIKYKHLIIDMLHISFVNKKNTSFILNKIFNITIIKIDIHLLNKYDTTHIRHPLLN